MKSFSKILVIVILIILVLAGILFFFWQKSKKPETPKESLRLPTGQEEIFLPETLPKIMKISSPAFENNSNIPSKYTCDGQDINPPLEIKDIPEGNQSLALIVDDPDAPMGTFLHWLVWNIPPDVSLIEEDSLSEGAFEGENDFGKESYGGPCPPSGTHRYFFKVYALDKKLDLVAGSSLKEVEVAMKDHILDQAQLIGLYQRK